MITKLGLKFREIREVNDHRLMDMAKNLGVSSAFLSSIEHGKKQPPKDLIENLSASYAISNQLKSALIRECDILRTTVTIQSTRPAVRETAAVFARRAGNLPDQRLKEISRLLMKDEKDE